MNILYNAAKHRGIPPAGVAQVSGDSAAAARSGYDREWPAGRVLPAPRRRPDRTAAGFPWPSA
ncbi:MAG: hypothetical protein M3536_01165, partial [Actinomycetota bacterium]|nr:hypothetical protein [Actinomycetota bacterium]